MKRIGILLDSTDCSRYLYETVRELAESGRVKIFFLVNSGGTSRNRGWAKVTSTIRRRGLFRFLALAFFRLWTAAEQRIFSLSSEAVREHCEVLALDEFEEEETIYLSPDFSRSGFLVRYPKEDIDRIKSLDLDVMIRGNASGIFKGDILESAKEGILSLHHGDNRWNRGGPPAFWEVYGRKPTTGFVIQILTEELDGGSVLVRGNLPTRRSYTENLVNLYNQSNPHMARIVLAYASDGRLPSPEEELPYGGDLLQIPSLAQSVSYVVRTVLLFSSLAVERFVLKKHPRWGVAFVKGPWRRAILRRGKRIPNPPNRFLADPFVITRGGRTVCFVEDYSYEEGRARITAIEILGDDEHRILGPALEEPFHMSFPYLFEYEGDLYMVPEALESNAIRLYKCVEFPLRWEHQKTILDGITAVDSMIFEHRGTWWLLTTTAATEASDRCSQLKAFYAENPLSDEWTAHKENPLALDASVARNGGLLDVDSPFPIRVRQEHGFNQYGVSLTLARMTDLTPSSFAEEEIGRIEPTFFDGIAGCHHMHSNGDYTVYDYVKTETVSRQR